RRPALEKRKAPPERGFPNACRFRRRSVAGGDDFAFLVAAGDALDQAGHRRPDAGVLDIAEVAHQLNGGAVLAAMLQRLALQLGLQTLEEIGHVDLEAL